jgi:predicted nuclease of restriction endonuclease-like RecB superfamily
MTGLARETSSSASKAGRDKSRPYKFGNSLHNKENPLRFSLQDIRKHVQRRGGELFVNLHFLRPGESRSEIARLIALYEQCLGQPQRTFNVDEARACVGEYRLANCLMATLSAWYVWRVPDWNAVLLQPTRDALEQTGIMSPVQLRLALFDFVNAQYGGFLEMGSREEALASFAIGYGLEGATLEYLLALDSDDEAVLMRAGGEGEQPPTPGEVAALYNQWVFEAALFNASEVFFAIDCGVFGERASSGVEAVTTGVGAVIKRLCYLARKLGVYYDLAYEPGTAYLRMTLYGPQDMTGAPQQYGLRLARLCRLLLGYGRVTMKGRLASERAGAGREAGSGGLAGGGKPRPYISSSAVVEARATVHFLQRSYQFAMDAKLLALLPVQDEPEIVEEVAEDVGSRGVNQDRLAEQPSPCHAERVSRSSERSEGEESVSSPRGILRFAQNDRLPKGNEVYDSSIEQFFAEAFTSLVGSFAADGWRLEREPEPLLLPSHGNASQGIFIPDFALTRDRHRIYLEILGFWTPSYRERKLQKLQQLKGRRDILLAFPVEARGAFASLAPDYPLVEYDGQLSATEVVGVLRRHVDDFAERLAQVDVEAVRRIVFEEGWLPERACYSALHCYRRAELSQAVERVTGGGVAYMSGVGLFAQQWMEQLGVSFVEWLEERKDRRVSVTEALSEWRNRQPVLNDCDETTFEALLGLWPSVHLRRSSMFEAVVTLAGEEYTLSEDQDEAQAAPRKVVRERRAAYKKRPAEKADSTASQQNLWE